MRHVIRYTRNFKNIKSLKTLYYAYICSKLEYFSVAWVPHYNVHIMCLERIQHRFSKFLYMVKRKVSLKRYYQNIHLLNDMNLKSLKVRRIKSNLCVILQMIIFFVL